MKNMVQNGKWLPAHNREEFKAQGATSARMGNTRSPGNEYRMPVFGEGCSWQAKAFAEGFREECAKLGQTFIPWEA